MPSAPEIAAGLALLCEALLPSERDALAFRWIDRCVRVHAPAALERCGYPKQAAAVRTLPEIARAADVAAARAAMIAAARDVTSDGDEDAGHVLAGLFCLATVEKDMLDESPDFEAVVITTVTGARCLGATTEEQQQAADVRAAVRRPPGAPMR